eukprot:355789-Chlamydomonas_euryale.AAC.2
MAAVGAQIGLQAPAPHLRACGNACARSMNIAGGSFASFTKHDASCSRAVAGHATRRRRHWDQ